MSLNYKRLPILLMIFMGLIISFSFLVEKPDYDIVVEKRFGGGRFDVLNQVKENLSGGFVAVGSSKSRSEGKEDFFIILTDRECELLAEKRLGRRDKDEAHAVALADDGGYVIVGFSESRGEGHQGGRDAVVLKLDENLRDVWFQEEAFSGPGDEEFNDIIAINNRGFVITGHRDNQLFTVMIDQEGEELWRYLLPGYGYSEGKALLFSSQGEIIITGAAGDQNDEQTEQILVLALSIDGVELWESQYETDNNLTSGTGIIELPNGNFAIGAQLYEGPKYKADGGLLLISAVGHRIRDVPYGDYDRDRINGITQNYAGEIIMVGETRGRGQNRENGWILKVNPDDGKRIWKNDQDNYLGKELRDQLLDVIHTSEGAIVMVGYTTRAFLSGEGWMIKLQPEVPNKEVPKEDDVTISTVEFIDQDQNAILTSTEQGYLKVSVKNNSNRDFYNLALRVRLLNNQTSIHYLDYARLGQIQANRSLEVLIPLYPTDSLEAGSLTFSLRLLQDQSNFSQFEDFILTTDRQAQPELAFENVEFEAMTSKGFRRGSNMRLVGNVVNQGNLTAHNVLFRYQIPARVRGLSPKMQMLGDLAPGESRRISAEFEPEFIYFDDQVPLEIWVTDSTTNFRNDHLVQVDITEEEIKPQPVVRDLLPEWVGFSDSTEIEVNDSTFGIRLNLYTNDLLTENGVRLIVNNRPAQVIEQHIDQFVHDVQNKNLYQYQYRYFGSFPLDTGANQIHAVVTNTAGEMTTPAIEVTYNPVRPTLRLLSIGVPVESVKEFATNDALIFAETFQEAGSIYFDTIDLDLRSDRNNTFKGDLASTFFQLKKDYFAGLINPEDLLLVFISSHATVATPGTFQIKASNYDGFFPDRTCIDYVEVIERFLSQINCQKIVFLDVFNEYEEGDDDPDAGPDVPELSQEFIKLMANRPRTTPVILSCSPGQASYEDHTLEKGYFAQAIFDALQDQNRNVLDVNKNNVITAREFYEQLKKGVNLYASNNHQQTPFFDDHGLEGDFTIVHVRGYGN